MQGAKRLMKTEIATGLRRLGAPAAALLGLLVFLFATAVSPCRAQYLQTLQRKNESRDRVLKWCKENAVIIKGMTKDEVRNIYGRPDRRFNYNYETEQIEMWKYNFPGHPRGLYPLTLGPHSSRWGTLYFKDDILVNVAH